MELSAFLSELRKNGVRSIQIELFETLPVTVTADQVRDAIMGPPPEPKDPRLCGYAGCESETDSNFRTGYCMVHTLKEAGVR